MGKFILRVKKFIAFVSIIGMLVGGGYFVYEYTDIFKSTYTITLDGNGLELENSEISVNKDGTVTLPTPSRKGYTFDGWYLGEKKCQETIVISSDQKLTAHWTPIKYDIKFIVDNETTTKSCNYDSIPTIASPTKECYETGYDYVFAGWEPALEKVQGEAEYTAVFEKVIQKKNLNITCNKDIGKFASAGSYDYNTTVNLSVHDVKGYIFEGWYKENILLSNDRDISITLTQDITIEARYICDTASITYNNTKNAINPNVTSYTIEDGTITLQALQVKGYNFVGWYTDVQGGGKKVTKINAKEFEDITLYAYFTTETYTLTILSDNEEAGTCSSNQAIYEYNTYAFLSASENDGYEFLGWFIDDTLYSSDINTSILVTDNIVIEARFGYKTYTITYIKNKDNIDNEFFVNNNLNPISYTMIDDDIILQNITVNGYYFGWYTEAIGGDKVNIIDTSQTRDITLYAHFTLITFNIEYQYTYNNNGFKKTYTVEDSDYTLPTPTRTGYNFVGWSTSSDPIPRLSVVIKQGSYGDKKFIANWQSNANYTINLVVDGTTLTEKISKTTGSSITKPIINASKYGMTGYLINDWYTDSQCTQKYTFSTMPNKNMTLYSKWEYMLGSGFVEYLDEFQSGDIEIDSYYEFVSLVEYIRFYAIQDQVKFKVTYTTASSNLTLQALNDSVFSGYYMCNYGANIIDMETPQEVLDKCNNGNFNNADPYERDVYKQQDYAFTKTNDIDRTTNNDVFKINNVGNTLQVHTSNQLVYALEKGLKPICVANSPAEKMYNKAKSILNQICDEDMSDLEKVQAIYEWMILNIDYDHKAANTISSNWGMYDAWYLEGIFNNQKGVCDAISKAMVVLCKIENIPVIRVAGTGHAWNKVYINNTWYGIDATHGDIGLSDANISTMSYTSFLFTDSFKKDVGYIASTYDNSNYINIECATVYNYYDTANFTFSGSEYDLIIDSKNELISLFKYLNTLDLTSSSDYITLEITFGSNYSLIQNDLYSAIFDYTNITSYTYTEGILNTLGRYSYIILLVIK